MIDWNATHQKFGYDSPADLIGIKRPKVVCVCDCCGKHRNIAVRVKSRIKNNQLAWKCPACVALGRSSDISTQMQRCWSVDSYRDSQLSRKAESDYKELQAQKSRERWEDGDYRDKLETGINIDAFLSKASQLFGDQFSYDIDSFINWKNRITIICHDCGTTFTRMPLGHLRCGACPACKIPGGLRRLLPDGCLFNDRIAIAPLELDVFLPTKSIALEYHGVYWHSYGSQESVEEKMRHQTKALMCLSKGIRLYQFFDFEWKRKRAVIESMLGNLFGRSIRIGARTLRIAEMDNKTVRSFFDSTHLQGHRNAKYTFALYDEHDIVMAMSFSKYHDGFEVIRLATKLGYHVPGGASRLLSYFRKKVTGSPLYSFADLRHSTGTTYVALGFKHLRTSKPNYFYYKNSIYLSRQQCQKHKLAALLPNFNPYLSEPENMFVNGFRRVWDAGHMKFVL